MTNLSIRAAGAADVETLARLNAEIQELHVASRPDQFKPTRLEEVSDWFGKFLLNPGAKAWLAEVDGTVVGYVTALAHERPENPFCPARKYWELDHLGVRVAFRGKGAGSALIEKVVHEARAAGVEVLELSSWAFNQSAHRVFSRSGFASKVVRFELRLTEPDSSNAR